MKIALIGNDYLQQFPLENYGGIETSVENLAWGLYNQKIDFFVVVPKRQVTKEYPFKIIETECLPSNLSGKNGYFFAYQVAKILQKESFDIIWSQSHWSVEPFLNLNKPIICTFQDSIEKQNGWMHNHKYVKYRFISEFQFNNWVKYDWEKQNSFKCYTGLVDEEFDLEINKDNYFLWCAGLNWGLEAKGLDYFIKISEEYKKHNFIAYGVGNNNLENKLKAVKNSNFQFLGALNRGENHRQVFKKALGFFMPTRLPEAFGRTIIESFSKGTPVYGSNNGSLNELIEQNVNGYKISLDNYNINLDHNFDYKLIFEKSKKFHINKEIEYLYKKSEEF
jgi:glycosyltransferase involved in cell wall biosynthesis